VTGDYFSFYDVVHGDRTFVAVGYASFRFGRSPRLFTSLDGSTWTAQSAPAGNGALHSVAWGDGAFVAVGGGSCFWGCSDTTILTSTDAIEWKEAEHDFPEPLLDVSYGNGTFVAVGEYGSVMTSTNAVKWTAAGGVGISSIAYGNGWFVGAGQFADGLLGRSVLFISSNGVAWQQTYSEPGEAFHKVAFGGGLFLVPTVDGRMLVSSGGIEWRPFPTGATELLYDVTFGNGSFVAVGNLGTILQTERELQMQWRGMHPPELSFRGPVGPNRYRIDASDDPAAPGSWTALDFLSVTDTPHVWRDTAVGQPARKFYRAVLLP
jgi:hypothetical protein